MTGLFQMVGLLLAQLLDYKTTTLGLDNGASEANGIVSMVVDNYGYTGFLIFKIVFSVVFGVLLWNAPKVAWTLTIMYMGVALWNLHLIAGLPAF